MEDIFASIKYMETTIKSNLKELDGDTTSDYARYILNANKHYQTAIDVMLDIVNPSRGYAE